MRLESNREQLVVCLRWVAEDYTVFEDTLGLIQVSDTKAVTILAAIKDVILRLGIKLEDCRGQGYDGASNFQGCITGVAKLIQDEVPSALPVHCRAHCTNLALQDVARKCHSIRDALDFSMELIQIIRYSPKRQVLFEEMKKACPENPGLKPLCPPRWTVRTGAISSIVKNYDPLLDTLSEVQSGSSDEYSRRGGGLLAQMDRFQTFFGLQLSILVFSAAEQLSVSLQGENTIAEDVVVAVKACKRYLQRQRSDEEFDRFLKTVMELSEDKTEKPTLPRYRRAPKRLDEGSSGHRFDSVETYYRQQYYEVIDAMTGELDKQFDQPNFSVVRDIETILINAANDEKFEISGRLKELYAKDLDLDRLSTQLKMLQDLPDKTKIKHVTKVSTIIQLFNAEPVIKRMFCEVHKLLKIYLTIPVTTSTAERTFSVLRRLKTYLRSTMTQARLNHCMLLHVYKSGTDSLNLVNLAGDFAARNERRHLYFGQFTGTD